MSVETQAARCQKQPRRRSDTKASPTIKIMRKIMSASEEGTNEMKEERSNYTQSVSTEFRGSWRRNEARENSLGYQSQKDRCCLWRSLGYYFNIYRHLSIFPSFCQFLLSLSHLLLTTISFSSSRTSLSPSRRVFTFWSSSNSWNHRAFASILLITGSINIVTITRQTARRIAR